MRVVHLTVRSSASGRGRSFGTPRRAGPTLTRGPKGLSRMYFVSGHAGKARVNTMAMSKEGGRPFVEDSWEWGGQAGKVMVGG